MKKMYALIMCMTVCGAALFAQTAADFSAPSDGKGGVKIRSCVGKERAVVIPATIDGKAVTAFDYDDFHDEREPDIRYDTGRRNQHWQQRFCGE